MSNLITVRQMLSEMETGAIFHIRGVHFNRTKKTGGEVYEYQAILLRGDNNPLAPAQQDGLVPNPGEHDRPLTAAETKTVYERRNPNHSQFFTRNVAVCQNGQRTTMIRKIAIPLVVYYNGKIVVP